MEGEGGGRGRKWRGESTEEERRRLEEERGDEETRGDERKE